MQPLDDDIARWNQSSERENELSENDYYTHFRGLDDDIARWKQIDPKINYSFSPYASMNNNPVMNTDVLGDSAWSYLNSWNADYISMYRDYVSTQTEEYKKNGANFTCEDFALNLIIDFASRNNLPFSFTNETGTLTQLLTFIRPLNSIKRQWQNLVAQMILQTP